MIMSTTAMVMTIINNNNNNNHIDSKNNKYYHYYQYHYHYDYRNHLSAAWHRSATLSTPTSVPSGFVSPARVSEAVSLSFPY